MATPSFPRISPLFSPEEIHATYLHHIILKIQISERKLRNFPFWKTSFLCGSSLFCSFSLMMGRDAKVSRVKVVTHFFLHIPFLWYLPSVIWITQNLSDFCGDWCCIIELCAAYGEVMKMLWGGMIWRADKCLILVKVLHFFSISALRITCRLSHSHCFTEILSITCWILNTDTWHVNCMRFHVVQ